MTHRKELEVLINANGGEYRGNLTKDVTHLIAKVPSGNKYVYAGYWGVKIVALEWLEQSLERGMILDEDLYSLLLPEDERGRNAWIRRTDSTTSVGKRARNAEVGTSNPRQLRRTASAKLSNQSLGIWTDIVGAETSVIKTESSEWDDNPKESAPVSGVTKVGGMFQTIERNHQVFSIDVRNVAQTEATSWPPNEVIAKVDSKPLFPEQVPRQGIFHGRTFVLHGFGEKKVDALSTLNSRDSIDFGRVEFDTTGTSIFPRRRSSTGYR